MFLLACPLVTYLLCCLICNSISWSSFRCENRSEPSCDTSQLLRGGGIGSDSSDCLGRSNGVDGTWRFGAGHAASARLRRENNVTVTAATSNLGHFEVGCNLADARLAPSQPRLSLRGHLTRFAGPKNVNSLERTDQKTGAAQRVRSN
ncbi:hypothetical protein FA95DRAFT_1204630 [Auriscalpium vulgare]|uniref:Uncharacterized protein n=1 Tax=Auriscalpium vulgare TaxID=40419 RepID=A0ACB8RV46_9AGAM|nr:hypothetical protein FA95DRAFT_1204630 [Auriscalpium vulgare]